MLINHDNRPYERKADENDLVYSHLKAFTDLSKQLTNKELKELSTLVTLDVWRDEGYTGQTFILMLFYLSFPICNADPIFVIFFRLLTLSLQWAASSAQEVYH